MLKLRERSHFSGNENSIDSISPTSSVAFITTANSNSPSRRHVSSTANNNDKSNSSNNNDVTNVASSINGSGSSPGRGAYNSSIYGAVSKTRSGFSPMRILSAFQSLFFFGHCYRNSSSTNNNSNKNHIWHEARIKWNLLSRTTKFFILAFTSFFLILILGRMVDAIYQQNSESPLLLSEYNRLFSIHNNFHPDNTAGETSFSVVINTYKRPDMLRDAVRHYGETCGRRMGVAQVFVIWAELQVKPPDPKSFFYSKQPRDGGNGLIPRWFVRRGKSKSKLEGTKMKERQRSDVEIIQVARDSLNSRFLPISNLKSQAIFMVDDDIRVDCESLMTGFLAWKANPHAMVGYYPRLAAPVKSPAARRRQTKTKMHYIYQAWPIVWWRHRMNFILTKASFLHSKYLSIYSNPSIHPTEVLDYVDQHMNCEDVAMALLVANVTSAASGKTPLSKKDMNEASPPYMIYVEGSVSDGGIFNGISSKSGHMNTRSKCLDDLTQIYQTHGWPRPFDRAYPLRQASWVQHATSWQYGPSNVFEWGALGNVFK